MNGIILIDKPRGWTSFDVVAKARSILRNETGNRPKIGHTGTLDPLATGLLVLLIGSYTKQAEIFSKLDKTYEVTMRLGQISTTGDEEGNKETISNYQPLPSQLTTVFEQFEGDIEQIPPIYSAIKVAGQRAYKLAREGKAVSLSPRPVTIRSLYITRYQYPEVDFTAEVTSGTFIRSLVSDIGEQLTTGAYTTALRRLQVGTYSITQALPTEQLNERVLREHLLLG